MAWADSETWDKVVEAVNAMDERDIKTRAELARTARRAKKSRHKTASNGG